MIPTYFALAAVLIVTDRPAAVPPELLPAVASVAEAWEILDPRERRYVFAFPQDASNDLELVRRRWKELKDAPPLCDCIRFPSREVCGDAIRANRRAREQFEAESCLHPEQATWYAEAIADCEPLYAAWDAAQDANCDYYYLTVRRAALAKLRERIGFANYYAGTMPPCVPVWRFHFSEE